MTTKKISHSPTKDATAGSLVLAAQANTHLTTIDVAVSDSASSSVDSQAQSHGRLLNEVRYAERLCQRTARLYRRFAFALAWATLVSGSGAFIALKQSTPGWLVALAGLLWVALQAAGQVIKPGERAALNIHEAKRYAKLRTSQRSNKAASLQRELDKLRETDIPEVESLRDVAWNDVMTESGNGGEVVELSRLQRVMKVLS